ncbi:MAG: hypothetical protein RIA08_17820 [Roseovarius sp.]|uniref:hypothetical protein n=1 Tax=Roseovarius sp. TaxID=1486281 RepID=UPI0032EE1E55
MAGVVMRYGLAGGFVGVAMVAARHEVYWLCIAGVAGAGVMIVWIVVKTKTGPVTLDAYKDQQIMVDRNKID